MFQSYKIGNYLGKKDDYWEYELTDNEFGIVVGVHNSCVLYGCGVCSAVIQEYGKRNLNVAANIALALVWGQKQYFDWFIQQIIDDNKEYNQLFQQYEKDIQKYLTLL
jgi:hypothetical protein